MVRDYPCIVTLLHDLDQNSPDYAEKVGRLGSRDWDKAFPLTISSFRLYTYD